MKLSKYNYAYLQLFLMMAVSMAVSFIPEQFREFFGDWLCNGATGSYVKVGDYVHWEMKVDSCRYISFSVHDATYHWGYRHWLFFAFGLFFVVVSIVRMVNRLSEDE